MTEWPQVGARASEGSRLSRWGVPDLVRLSHGILLTTNAPSEHHVCMQQYSVTYNCMEDGNVTAEADSGRLLRSAC